MALPAPEDMVDLDRGQPLKLDVKCNACGKGSRHVLEYVVMNPKEDVEAHPGWDGFLLSKIIVCKGCGAVDDYTLKSGSRVMLRGEAFRAALREEGEPRPPSRVIRGTSAMWDGTIARRPTQMLNHLQKLAEGRPRSAEAWRRLGNAQNRFAQMEKAEASWRKAVELSPADLEALASLVILLADAAQWPAAFGFIRQAIAKVADTREIEAAQRQDCLRSILRRLETFLDEFGNDLALMAAWSPDLHPSARNPTMHVSSVDLRQVDEWDRLEEFLLGPTLVSAQLTPELPEEESTQLQRLLAGHDPAPSGVRAEPVVRVEPRQGRNDPCSCGSGKKYKTCCAR